MVKWFSFDGRINRLPYIWIAIFAYGIGYMFNYENEAIKQSGSITSSGFIVIFGIICLLISIPLIWFLTAVAVKRMHDMGFSGWYALALLIPLIDILVSLLLMIKKGDSGENKYGPDPLSKLPIQ